MIVTIKDETFTGEILNELNLEFATENVTVKEIISQRVFQEVENYNKKLPEVFNGLVKPSEAEKTLNGYKVKNKKAIDGEKQVYIALEAFNKNSYFVLIDNQQAESLEEKILLTQHSKISFLKLTPLVGG
ncbi:hypothetical protein R9C00_04265 [Flammeovirgaceae bacterium SG7u.111]|nr:hypothetical protein [Flammeovirgaceae bacterium SG7u.132]WPO36661.1 hypothetical protein R9C00_04265 [Flammeovirgaceae bacterium SG7u.111]